MTLCVRIDTDMKTPLSTAEIEPLGMVMQGVVEQTMHQYLEAVEMSREMLSKERISEESGLTVQIHICLNQGEHELDFRAEVDKAFKKSNERAFVARTMAELEAENGSSPD